MEIVHSYLPPEIGLSIPFDPTKSPGNLSEQYSAVACNRVGSSRVVETRDTGKDCACNCQVTHLGRSRLGALWARRCTFSGNSGVQYVCKQPDSQVAHTRVKVSRFRCGKACAQATSRTLQECVRLAGMSIHCSRGATTSLSMWNSC